MNALSPGITPGDTSSDSVRNSKQEARAALAKILEYEHTGLVIDDRQTVGDYLTDWMRTKALTLKPTTIADYQRYITQDLLPSLGHLRLETLTTAT